VHSRNSRPSSEPNPLHGATPLGEIESSATPAEQLDCCSDPTGLCLLNEALESKRSAREGLLRAIRRAFPEAGHKIGQLAAARSQPVAGCGRSDAARNPLPISNAILRSRAGLASECDSPLAF
jgi:hypothetical protein